MAGVVSPLFDVGVAPGAERVLDGAVLALEGVAHGEVAFGGVGGAPVVVGGSAVAEAFGGVLVLVGPLGGDVAVVVLEIL